MLSIGEPLKAIRYTFVQVQQILTQNVQLNMKDVMADLYQRLHIELSTAEKDQIYNRYIRPMRLVLDSDGNVSIELGKK